MADPNDPLRNRAPGCALTFYKLNDGSLRVRYMWLDRSYVIVPMPGREREGWEEALPISVGRYEPELQAYRMSDVFAGMEAMARLAAEIRTGKSLRDFNV